MFTGIVKDLGTIGLVERIPGGLGLRITAGKILERLHPGDSIAVNGVCQTVVDIGSGFFSVEALQETLRRTTLSRLRTGDRVNLEPSVGPEDLFGGHLVAGHVDGLGVIRARRRRAGDVLLQIGAPAGIIAQVVERGSVAVDGVSLTVTAVRGDAFTVALIPYTLRETTLGNRKANDPVNLETDVIVKVVQRLLGPILGNKDLTEERLQELGF
jgi:riboflavin synthase